MSCMLIDVGTKIGHDNEKVAGIMSPAHRYVLGPYYPTHDRM